MTEQRESIGHIKLLLQQMLFSVGEVTHMHMHAYSGWGLVLSLRQSRICGVKMDTVQPKAVA